MSGKLVNCDTCNRSTVAELRNRFVLDNNVPNADRYQEHIIVWAFEAEKQIGTGQFFIPDQEEEFKVGSNTFRLPDCVYKLQDVCMSDDSCYYTGRMKGGSFKRSCTCGGSSCRCSTWYEMGKYLKFSKSVESVKLIFTGLMLDDDGFPTIPENHIGAISAYLDYKLANIRFKEGKVGPVVWRTLRLAYLSAFRACRSQDNHMTEQEAAQFSIILNSKFPMTFQDTCAPEFSCDTEPETTYMGSALGAGLQQTITQDITNVTNNTYITGGTVFTCKTTVGNNTNTLVFAEVIGLTLDQFQLFIDGSLMKYNDPNAEDNEIDAASYDTGTGTIVMNVVVSDEAEVRVCYPQNL